MRCILIDNDIPALELLRSYIGKIPFLELTGSFDDPFAAMDFLMKNPVDLVLTGVEMDGIDGLQLISSLSNRPMAIFISARREYAVDGFALDAVDYLLKPVSFDRFLKAVNKAYETRSQRETPRMSPPAGYASAPVVYDHIFVKTENRLVRLLFGDILLIEGYGDYIKIHLRDNRVLLSLQNMSAFETRLPATDFARVHRSYIVAIDKIDEIERKRIKIGKHLIPISDSYQEGFLTRINN
jgi:DNA-binding LytR/AlgR family response regulator